jgi:betaine reductase
MDLQNQQRIKDLAAKNKPEDIIVVIGASDAEGAGIYAETVTAGDPAFAGPLSGVSLGLPVYHALDPLLKAEADPQAWEEQVSMMEMVVDGETLTKAVADMRQTNGLSVL